MHLLDEFIVAQGIEIEVVSASHHTISEQPAGNAGGSIELETGDTSANARCRMTQRDAAAFGTPSCTAATSPRELDPALVRRLP